TAHQNLQRYNAELAEARINEIRTSIAYQNAPSAVLKRQWEASAGQVKRLETLVEDEERKAAGLGGVARQFSRLETQVNRLDEMSRELERRISEQLMKMEE